MYGSAKVDDLRRFYPAHPEAINRWGWGAMYMRVRLILVACIGPWPKHDHSMAWLGVLCKSLWCCRWYAGVCQLLKVARGVPSAQKHTVCWRNRDQQRVLPYQHRKVLSVGMRSEFVHVGVWSTLFVTQGPPMRFLPRMEFLAQVQAMPALRRLPRDTQELVIPGNSSGCSLRILSTFHA